MSNILTFSIRSYNVLLEVQNRLSPEVQPNWTQEPLTLTDALGRVAPIHLELINNWDVLESVLEARFKDMPGERKIKVKKYALWDHNLQRDIVRSDRFESCFFPGRRIDMCILFENPPSPRTSCPNCHWDSCESYGGGSKW